MTTKSVPDRRFTPVPPGVEGPLRDAKVFGEIIKTEEVVIGSHYKVFCQNNLW